MLTFRKKKRQKTLISPEEILLDAHNLPAYNPHRLEGKLNMPIAQQSLHIILFLFFIVGAVLLGRTGYLMVVHGDEYAQLSKNNTLTKTLIFAERGIIYDRNNVPLAWNVPKPQGGGYESFDERRYATSTGVGHILGYVRLPARDKKGVFYRTGIEGVSGVELTYDEQLRGVPGTKVVETDARMNVVSEGVVQAPIPGKPLHLTIDSRLQEALNMFIGELAEEVPFKGGAGVMMDVRTGEILVMTSYPEYSSEAMVEGDEEKIRQYNSDPRTPFLNRVIAGQYTPGSIVKPYMALAGLTEGIITPHTTFVSTGALRVENPYHPGQYSVFKDWKAHGEVNVKQAIMVSSNVFFYYVGGGYGEMEGLGIKRINYYARLFGFGMPTGISLSGERFGNIPSPEWKRETFPSDPVWRIGDTYHTVIGQYGFQVTPIQAVRAVAAIANGGLLLTPRIETEYTHYGVRRIELPEEHFETVREGMRDAVQDTARGTARGLNVSYVNVAGKTGTAEIGAKKDFVHSWVTGFFPYENPRYAFAILMEHGPRKNLFGGTYVMRRFLDWMHTYTPEYVTPDIGTEAQEL